MAPKRRKTTLVPANKGPTKRSALSPEDRALEQAKDRLRQQRKYIRAQIEKSEEWRAANDEKRYDLEHVHLRDRLKKWELDVRKAQRISDESHGKAAKSLAAADVLARAKSSLSSKRSTVRKALKTDAAWQAASAKTKKSMEDARIKKDCARQLQKVKEAQDAVNAVNASDDDDDDNDDDDDGSEEDSMTAKVGDKRTISGRTRSGQTRRGSDTEWIASQAPPALEPLDLTYNSDNDDDDEDPAEALDSDSSLVDMFDDDDSGTDEWMKIGEHMAGKEVHDDDDLRDEPYGNASDIEAELEDGMDAVAVKRQGTSEIIATPRETLVPAGRELERYVHVLKFSNRPEVIGVFEIPDDEFRRLQDGPRKAKELRLAKKQREAMTKM